MDPLLRRDVERRLYSLNVIRLWVHQPMRRARLLLTVHGFRRERTKWKSAGAG